MIATKLWAHQESAVQFAMNRPGTILAMEMGVGKSLTTLALIDRYRSSRVLIACPLSVVRVWPREIARHVAEKWDVLALDGGGVKAKAASAEAFLARGIGERPSVVVVNHESLWREPFRALALRTLWDLLVVDECHRAKAPGGKLSRFLADLGMRVPRRLALTGTPVPHSPLDLYAQCRIVDRSVFGTSYQRFKMRYCNPPEAPIWMSDLSFKPIGDIQRGDVVLGWGKQDAQRNRFISSRVLRVHRREAEIVKATLASGRVIRCTRDHQWLSAWKGGRDRTDPMWVTVGGSEWSRLRGRKISLSHVIDLTPPLTAEQQRAADWLAGMYDGEGSRNTIAQSGGHNPETCARLESALSLLGIPAKFERASNGSKTSDRFILLGGKQTYTDFLNWTRGILVKRSWWERSIVGRQFNRRADAVVSVKPDGFGEVVSMQTETGNYICWGYASRNCAMGGYQNHQVVSFQHLDELAGRFARVAYQARKADVLDLPPEVHAERSCRLEPSAAALYARLEEDFWAEVDRGEVTIANALVKLLRLQQITGGSIKLDSGEMQHVSSAKEDLLADVLEDIPDPVVVFVRFTSDLGAVARVAERMGRIYGEVSGRRKDLDEARYPAGVQVLGVQIQAGGVGIDLTRAAVGIFYSAGYSLGEYLQACARLHRPGQTRSVTFLHLLAEGTVDAKVYQALARREEVVETILALHRRAAA